MDPQLAPANADSHENNISNFLRSLKFTQSKYELFYLFSLKL